MSKKNRKGLFLLAGVLTFGTAAALVSCGEKPGETVKEETIKTITITNAADLANLETGAEKTIELAITPDTIKADDARITVTSSDPATVKVEGRKLTALKAGTARITVKGDEITTSVNVTVTDPEPEFTLNSISITNKANLEKDWLLGGDEKDRTLDLMTDPAANIGDLIDEGKITAESSDPSVVSIMNVIKLSAKKVGTATITVKAAGKTDSVKITVTELPNIKVNTIKEIEEKSFVKQEDGTFKFTIPTDPFRITAAVAASDGENVVITDGTNFLNVYGTEQIDKLEVGKNYVFTAKVGQYYGTLQLKNGSYTLAETQDIKVPEVKVIDGKQNKYLLKDLAAAGKKNNNGPVEPTGLYEPKLVSLKGLEYVGGSNFIAKGHYYEFCLKKCNKEFFEVVKTLGVGDIIDVEGALIGWNGGRNYFNLVSTKAPVVVEKAIPPTKITLTAPTTATAPMTPIDLRSLVTMEPEGAKANVSYTIVDNDKILEQDGSKVIATKAGSITVTPIANKGTTIELAGEPTTLEFTGEPAQNIYTKAVKKTFAEMAALPAGADKSQLYIVEGKLTAAEDTDYGNATLTDATGTFETYGIGNSYLNIKVNEDASAVTGYSNPKAFKTELLNKEFQVNDTIKLLVYKDEYKGKPSYKTVFLAKTQGEAIPDKPVENAITVAEALAKASGTNVTTNVKILKKGPVTSHGTYDILGADSTGYVRAFVPEASVFEIGDVVTLTGAIKDSRGKGHLRIYVDTAVASTADVTAWTQDATTLTKEVLDAKSLTLPAYVTCEAVAKANGSFVNLYIGDSTANMSLVCGPKLEAGKTYTVKGWALGYNGSRLEIFDDGTAVKAGAVTPEPETPTTPTLPDGLKTEFTWQANKGVHKDETIKGPDTESSEFTYTEGDAKVTVKQGTSSTLCRIKYAPLRLYGGQIMDIYSATGKDILAVQIVSQDGKNLSTLTTDQGTIVVSDKTVTLTATAGTKKVTITNTAEGQAKLVSFIIVTSK